MIAKTPTKEMKIPRLVHAATLNSRKIVSVGITSTSPIEPFFHEDAQSILDDRCFVAADDGKDAVRQGRLEFVDQVAFNSIGNLSICSSLTHHVDHDGGNAVVEIDKVGIGETVEIVATSAEHYASTVLAGTKHNFTKVLFVIVAAKRT